jgi:hypothetical protein
MTRNRQTDRQTDNEREREQEQELVRGTPLNCNAPVAAVSM